MKRQAKNRFCYGWVIVFACVVLSASSVGLLSYFNAFFVTSVTQALGISRSTFMLYSTLSTVTTMLFMPFVGTLFKKHSMKLLLIIGTCMGAASHFCYSLSGNIFGFYAGAVIGGIGSCLFGAIPMALLLTNWFNEKRGLAMGIAFTGSGIVSSFLSPVISNIIAVYGWQMGYRVIGLAILIITIPTILALVKVHPNEMGLAPYGEPVLKSDEKQLTGFTKKQVLRTGSFWFFALAVFLLGMVAMSTQQQLVSYWEDMGNDAAFTANMYALVMLVGMFAKVFMGGLYDKAGIKAATNICCLITAASFVGLIFFSHGSAMIIPAALLGVTTSIIVIVPTYITGRFFGDREYGFIYGIITTILYLGISVGIMFSASVYDSTGTYKTVWTIFALIIPVVLVSLQISNSLSKKAYKSILGIERED